MLMISWADEVKPIKGWAVMYKGEIVYIYDQGKRVFSRRHLAENALKDMEYWGTHLCRNNEDVVAMIKECTIEEV